MGRRTLRDDEVEAFRGKLCEAAMTLFAEQGYAAVTMRRLAESVGCSHATPYRYFDSKEAIFDAVRVLGFTRLCDHLRDSLAPHTDPMVRLEAGARGYVQFSAQQPHAYRIMFQLSAPVGTPALRQATRAAWMLLHDTVSAAIAAGVIRGDADTVAHLIWASGHGLCSLQLAGKLSMGRSMSSLIEPMIRALIRAHLPTDLPTDDGAS